MVLTPQSCWEIIAVEAQTRALRDLSSLNSCLIRFKYSGKTRRFRPPVTYNGCSGVVGCWDSRSPSLGASSTFGPLPLSEAVGSFSFSFTIGDGSKGLFGWLPSCRESFRCWMEVHSACNWKCAYTWSRAASKRETGDGLNIVKDSRAFTGLSMESVVW